MREEIGKRIKELRLELNMTKEEFAKYIGISGQYLGTVERGQNCLSLDKIMTLCEKTGKCADYILFGKKNCLEDNTKNILKEFNYEQIHYAFETIESIALYLKNNS